MKKSERIQSLWADITPEMMTEEETGAEDNYVRHRQNWRSLNFNKLMDKLDEAKSDRSLAKKRVIGDDVDCPTPPNAKKWMIATEAENGELELSGDSDTN